MGNSLGFGDIFRFRSNDYVYFAESVEDDVIYAGKILDQDVTHQVSKMADLKGRTGSSGILNPMFSFVVLSTSEFEHRAVLCAVNSDDVQPSVPHFTLDNNDKENIKQEILTGPAPAQLKRLVELLT